MTSFKSRAVAALEAIYAEPVDCATVERCIAAVRAIPEEAGDIEAAARMFRQRLMHPQPGDGPLTPQDIADARAIVDAYLSRPAAASGERHEANLGIATNRELLDEMRARIEMGNGCCLDYSTVRIDDHACGAVTTATGEREVVVAEGKLRYFSGDDLIIDTGADDDSGLLRASEELYRVLSKIPLGRRVEVVVREIADPSVPTRGGATRDEKREPSPESSATPGQPGPGPTPQPDEGREFEKLLTAYGLREFECGQISQTGSIPKWLRDARREAGESVLAAYQAARREPDYEAARKELVRVLDTIEPHDAENETGDWDDSWADRETRAIMDAALSRAEAWTEETARKEKA